MKNQISLKNIPLLIPLKKFFKPKKVKVYIVGGIIRDSLINRKKDNLDIDLAVEKKAIGLAREFADMIKGGYVVLDKEHGAARVVKKYRGINYTVDFTDFRGKNLQEDLKHRDFTINALALDLSKQDELIDPYKGQEDIKKKTIRVLGRDTFKEDPLRILRAFSLSSMLGFKIEKNTEEAAGLNKRRLEKVSSERIRDEVFKILGQENFYKYLLILDELGILSVILPEVDIMRGVAQGPYHHLDVWMHTLETCRQIDEIVKEARKNKLLDSYLNEVITADRKRAALIKFGALLHDIGKPQSMRRKAGKILFHGHERIGRDISRHISIKFKLSNDEREALERMVFWHLRPGYLADVEEVTPRAVFRFFRDARKDALSILLISLADQRSTRGPLTSRASRASHEKLVAELIKQYFRSLSQKKLPRLITGNDLIKKLNLIPSPIFSKILREVEELQAAGEIKTKAEALETARRIVRD
ncbi:MAG: HD domain-containing protein [Candidatus Omnitrophica bacterium]|nr:HD domain-containing protein [Candidatus Omnitrophota bacterium]MDD5236701.1 HD domain-containing protein [Candidatus Omnitrophota bacterium]MDD5610914.1 HD domain-containing protein [Candidatus Omnitrophota bacterium]